MDNCDDFNFKYNGEIRFYIYIYQEDSIKLNRD